MNKKIHRRPPASARLTPRTRSSTAAAAKAKPDKTQNPCAREVLKTVPVVMRDIIRHMHSGRDASLSVPQFRVMVHILKHPGSSLAQLANFLGMAPPATSKLVDALVRQGLVERQMDSNDRRRITLNITRQGQSVHEQAEMKTLVYLTLRFNDLGPAEQRTIASAMVLLYKTFAPPEATSANGSQS